MYVEGHFISLSSYYEQVWQPYAVDPFSAIIKWWPYILYKHIIRISTFLLYQCMYVCIVITYSEGKAEPCKVAIPALGPMNRGTQHFPVPVRA